MHKERIFVLLGALVGIVAAFLPWRYAFIFEFTGTDFWGGKISIVVFAIIAILAIIGNRKGSIDKGAPKILLMSLSGLLILFFVVLIAMQMVNKYDSPGYGLYLSLLAAFETLLIPFFIKDSGEMAVPSVEEIKDEIEDNAEIFEDQLEDVAEKVEEKVEEIGDKIEDKFDKDEEEEKYKSEEE
jgi:hypothetical protein